jgi:hypothetical protein
MVILCAFTVGAFGQSNPKIETITYTNTYGQRKTVRAVLVAVHEFYWTLEGSGVNTWLVSHCRTRLTGGEWEMWEKVEERPMPNATNALLQAVTEREDVIYLEATVNGITGLNEQNVRYWWENRRELHWLNRSYIIVP